MKVYAIFANDNKKGTTHKLFLHAIETFKQQGHHVDMLDLYEREGDMRFFRHDRATMESYPFYLENKERFLQADTLLIVFPLFWYSVPGILKTWIDMINGWAYKYESGTHASPLHKIKKVIVVYSAMQDGNYLTETLQNPVNTQISETCKFIGINDVEIYMVDNVINMSDEKLEQHINAVANLCT